MLYCEGNNFRISEDGNMNKNEEITLDVLDYEVLGALPKLLLKENGKRVRDASDWEARRKELYKTAVELQYGTMPPSPEFLDVDLLYQGKKWATYRITSGRKARPVSFIMRVAKPQNAEGQFPVIVDGDRCFDYFCNDEFVNLPLENGIGWAIFDRTEIAPDNKDAGRKAPLYEAYPEYTFGAIGAWAWGYSRCVDALLKLDLIDPDGITFTGHSRGAKTAMLAGILDTRASIVNPHQTCSGSCSCYRIRMEAINDQGIRKRSEMLADLMANFGFWMGQGMHDYANDPAKLPFDAHFVKAMIAPRTLLVSEGAHDIWANPLGSWMTTMAAKEVFDFLGVEENLLWYFRDGAHLHSVFDLSMLVNLILHKRNGAPLSDFFFRRPFKAPDLIF